MKLSGECFVHSSEIHKYIRYKSMNICMYVSSSYNDMDKNTSY